MNRFVRDPARPAALMIVVALHALAILGLLAIKPLHADLHASGAVEAILIFAPQEAAATPDPLAARDVVLRIPQPEVALPEIPVAERQPDTSITLPAVASVPLAATPTPAAAAPAPSVSPTIIEVEGVEYLHPPVPRYPAVSRRLREQGSVWLRVLVAIDGRPAEATVIRSSGSSRLDEAARSAVLEAWFRPYVEGGQPRAAYVRVPIEFSLRRG